MPTKSTQPDTGKAGAGPKALALLLVCVGLPLFAYGQAAVTARITQAVDEANLTTLRGNTHPLAQERFDQGGAPDALPAARMMLVLQRSPAQKAALDALLDQQQTPGSLSYHSWLTPQQFGQQFGPSDADIQAITSWLQSHGFVVNGVSNGRTVIEFSGNAGQVRQAFHTEIHRYTVNGQDHWANSSDPQIPAALAPVVAGISSLYNFPRQAMHEVVGTFLRSRNTNTIQPTTPLFTIPYAGHNWLAVAPADFSKIYNVPNMSASPAPAIQYNGDNQTIAIIGQSHVYAQDINAFRSLFGLPTPANLTTIVSGPDPGYDPGGAETEADLDTQWAGAVAPNAALDLVIAQSTEVSLGADLAAQYAVDNNIAPVLNESFGVCEFFLGTSGNAFYDQLWQQAAAEGITVTVSAGDSGSASCDRNAGTQGAAVFGLSVSGIASTPYNVSVGGTDFNDVADFASYWSTTQSDTPKTASALGYVPEMTWNQSCTNQEIFDVFDVATAEQSCNNATEKQDGLVQPGGGGGGQSNCTVSGQTLATCSDGYPKPSWQTGTGVPNDGTRDIPDVSLFASPGFNASFYIICEADLAPLPSNSSCDPFAATTSFVGIGGTSASAPAFAGIMTLVNQATGSRQGNANYMLYKLAAKSGAGCTSGANPAGTCVFYDIPAGSTIAMPCAQGSPNNPTNGPTCMIQTSGDTVGVLSGYSATTGYDLATGLGSVNAANLIQSWITSETALKASSTSLLLNNNTAVNITHGQSVPVAVTVTGSGGTPTGTVSLMANTGSGTEQAVGSATLNNGTASFSTTSLPGNPGGAPYTVFAQYSGDGTFSPSGSATQSVTVAPEASNVQIAYQLFDPTTGLQTNPNATTATFGRPAILRMNVTSQAGDACAQNAPTNTGCPTGTVTLTDNGNPLDGGAFALNSQGYTEDQVIHLTGGSHSIQTVYAGDVSYSASSETESITITKLSTTTTLRAGSSITSTGTDGFTAILTATGVPSGFPPTGSVNLYNGTTLVQTQPFVLYSLNNGTAQGQANFGVSSIPIGSESFTAQYIGDQNYLSSTSAPVVVSSIYGSTTTLTSSSPSVLVGTSVTFTAQIQPVPSGGPQMTGTVTFTRSSNGNVIAGPLTLPANGQVQVSTNSLLPPGEVVYANYSGDANYVQSLGSLFQTVTAYPTATTMTALPTSSSEGAPVTLTASVSVTLTGGPPLGGSVEFQYVQSGAPSSAIGSPVALTSGMASISTTILPAGSITIQAIYQGDSSHAQSTGQTIVNVAMGNTTTGLTSSSSTITQGASVTFTAQVKPMVAGGQQPLGIVSFTLDGTPVFSQYISSNGLVGFTASQLTVGSHQIVATYAGDSNYTGSTSPAVTETVNSATPGFTISANPTSVTVPLPGQSGSTTLTFTSMDGFTGSGSLTSPPCVGVAAEEITCTLSAFTLPANGTATATLTFHTTAASSATPSARQRQPLNPPPSDAPLFRLLALAGLLSIGGFLFVTRRRRRFNFILAGAIFAVLASGVACGTGGGSSGASNPGTPAGIVPGVNVFVTINGTTVIVPGLTVTVE